MRRGETMSGGPVTDDGSAGSDTPQDRWLGSTVVACVVGVSFAPIIIRSSHLPALGLAFWRNAVGAVILLAVARVRNPGWFRACNARQRGGMVIAGAFLGGHFAAWTASLEHTTVANSLAILSMQPALVVVAAWIVLGERPRGTAWLPVVLSIAGALVVGGADLSGATDRVYGNCLAGLGALAGAAYFVSGRRFRRELPVVPYAAGVFSVAALELLVLCGATRTDLAYDVHGYLWIGALVVAGQLLGHTIFNLLLGRLPAWAVAVTAMGETIGATTLAWVILGEPPTTAFWWGMPLVAVAVAWAVALASRGQRPPLTSRIEPVTYEA